MLRKCCNGILVSSRWVVMCLVVLFVMRLVSVLLECFGLVFVSRFLRLVKWYWCVLIVVIRDMLVFVFVGGLIG